MLSKRTPPQVLNVNNTFNCKRKLLSFPGIFPGNLIRFKVDPGNVGNCFRASGAKSTHFFCKTGSRHVIIFAASSFLEDIEFIASDFNLFSMSLKMKLMSFSCQLANVGRYNYSENPVAYSILSI